jgi:hypothetical protein
MTRVSLDVNIPILEYVMIMFGRNASFCLCFAWITCRNIVQ